MLPTHQFSSQTWLSYCQYNDRVNLGEMFHVKHFAHFQNSVALSENVSRETFSLNAVKHSFFDSLGHSCDIWRQDAVMFKFGYIRTHKLKSLLHSYAWCQRLTK